MNTEKRHNGHGASEVKLEKRFDYDQPLLRDHRIYDERVLMGVAHLSLAIDWARARFPTTPLTLKRFTFSSAMVVRPGERGVVTLTALPKDGAYTGASHYRLGREEAGSAPGESHRAAAFQLWSDNAPWVEERIDADRFFSDQTLQQWRGAAFYEHPEQNCYGPSLLSVERVVQLCPGTVLGRIAVCAALRPELPAFAVHPCVLDACHVVSSFSLGDDPVRQHRVPLMIKRIAVAAELDAALLNRCYCRAEKRRLNDQIAEMDIGLYDATGRKILMMEGFTTKTVPGREALVGAVAPAAAPSPVVAAPAATGTVAGLEKIIQRYLREKIASVVNRQPGEVPIARNFMDLGLESVNMIGTVNAMEKELGIELYPTLLFEYQNIASLATYLEEEHGEAFSVLLAASVIEPMAAENAKPEPVAAEIETRDAPHTGVDSSRTANPEQVNVDAIAIVGMSAYLPQSKNLDEFWQHLAEGRDLVGDVPANHWDYRPWFDENREAANKTYSRWGSFLEHVDRFDPVFFGVSPRLAQWMDPQLRLLLQSAQETFEDAGVINTIGGTRTDVYIGSCFHEYWDEVVRLGIPFEDYQSHSSALSCLSGTVSYTFDLQGASVPLDNACASSLTALHLGCRAIKNGECEQAFVAGVNLLLSPLHYVHFSRLQAFSPSGRCHTFDHKADGYVPGEGVVSVLIKPLAKAIAGGDNIHAIVRATAVNHTGRSNNPTSPRPELQVKLLREAWRKAGIDPRQLTYLEAHGTGTKLGDPIEINALKTAFKTHTRARGFCAIGSTKAHIGHLEGAAGLASLVKVILMMKHRRIPRMPNFERLNDYIKLDDSPFYINTELVPWRVEGGGARLAGISSFGMTGNNAHVVLEEYPAPPRAQSAMDCCLVPLSAQSETQLLEYGQKLLDYLRRQSDGIALADLAYTLQTGRQGFAHRAIFLARRTADLEQALRRFISGEKQADAFVCGHVAAEKDAGDFFPSAAAARDRIGQWFYRGEQRRLAEHWVRGLPVDWADLYAGELFESVCGSWKPCRMSLPTYPFAAQRYWMEYETPPIQEESELPRHPLLHKNLSGFSGLRFEAVWSGEEFFLAQHRVKGRRVLPGVAFLEMAREALTRALAQDDSEIPSSSGICLYDIVWLHPLVAEGGPLRARIELFPDENGGMMFDISQPAAGGARPHCQGRARIGAPRPAPMRDLDEIMAQCRERTLDAAECYSLFQRWGLDHGPAFRGLEEIHVGRDLALARIALPAPARAIGQRFGLHPGSMDSALQAVVGIVPAAAEMPNPALPFALDSLEIFSDLPDRLWVVVRSAGSGGLAAQDFDLCDDNGHVCVRLRGFSARAPEPAAQPQAQTTAKPAATEDAQPQAGDILLAPRWERIALETSLSPEAGNRRVAVVGGTGVHWDMVRREFAAAERLPIEAGDTPEALGRKLCALGEPEHIIWLAFSDTAAPLSFEALPEAQEQGVIACFRLIKALLQSGYGARPLEWTLLTCRAQAVAAHDSVEPAHAALHGLMGSLAKEYPNWRIRVLDLESDRHWPPQLFAAAPQPQGNVRACRDGHWYAQYLNPVPMPSEADSGPYRHGGVYVVIGGAGGIGGAWSEAVIRAYQARVIWIGRRPRDAAIDASLQRLAGIGPAPDYIAADAGDRESLGRAYQTVKQRHGRVHGLIHAAIVLQDQSLARMDENCFRAGLVAKVDTCACMAQVFESEALDFVLFFSSVQSFIKAPGQSNYAAGCTFKDAFAHRLAQFWPCRVRIVNWGYWGSVGIVTDRVYRERMARAGIGSIEPPRAMRALDVLLRGAERQLGFINLSRPLTPELGLALGGIKTPAEATGRHSGCSASQRFQPSNVVPLALAKQPPADPDTAGRRSGVGEYTNADGIRRLVLESLAGALKMDVNAIDPERRFSDFGVDSITGVNLVKKLNRALATDLKTTALFSYSTANELTEHILASRPPLGVQQERYDLPPAVKRSALAAGAVFHGRAAPAVEELSETDVWAAVPTAEVTGPAQAMTYRHESGGPALAAHWVRRPAGLGAGTVPEPVAIIGYSGRFGRAGNTDEFWQVLRDGEDLVEPVSRWPLPPAPNPADSSQSDCRHGALLRDIDRFDALFFNISGLEAQYMDPQQRLFLEEAWRALEHAGHAGDAIRGHRCGVYVGCTGGDYARLLSEQAPAQAFWGNSASITPARIAYHLDLQGPALAIDTACSSSLVAIHEACAGLRQGDVEMALAGGVGIQSTAEFYRLANRAGMLSNRGRCHSFDARADGFVPGEGVGVMVLKTQAAAAADGDCVHALIRASGINQDGASNGITAPNAKAQERLLRDIYRRFDIDPAHIQLVEAHGTGTALGDPIEFQALAQVFAAAGGRKNHCAIGSVKSNLGHTATAAGVTAVIKILLALRHRQMPPSLHFARGNPNIDFDASPFYVNTALRPWETEAGRPRRAAVSSFGFSGTNAHMVLEEAPPAWRSRSDKPGYLIVLSAHDPEALRRQAEQLAAHLERDTPVHSGNEQPDCGNISYTLLLGRKHFSHRLACVARNSAELCGQLRQWLQNGAAERVFVSVPEDNTLAEQPALQRYGNQCIRDCRQTPREEDYLDSLCALADLFVRGYRLDYADLFAGEQRSRIALPTYPFAGERYWVEGNGEWRAENGEWTDAGGKGNAALHPLVQRNTSDFNGQRFSSIFNGEEFFLRDHRVGGEKVLPGAAYLEMARAALMLASGQPAPAAFRLTDINWLEPLAVNSPTHLHIGLRPQRQGTVAFEIYRGADAQADPCIHCQGQMLLHTGAAMETPRLDLDAWRASCAAGELSAQQCYAIFEGIGVAYGPGHKGIETVFRGRDRALAKLSLPAAGSETPPVYVLHPGLLDSALQVSLGLQQPDNPPTVPALPFALETLEFFAQIPPAPWVAVRYSTGSGAREGVQKLDIDICDAQGNICLRLQGFSFRRMAEKPRAPDADRHAQEFDALIARLLWKYLLDLENIALTGFYERWREAGFAFLTDKGFPRGGDATSNAAEMQLDPLWEEWESGKARWAQAPDKRAQIALAEACLRALPDILRGKVPATDVIFPDSSMTLVEGIYRNNRTADYFNETLARTLVEYLNQRLRREPQARFRILEIGAGTGGTTAVVLPALRALEPHIGEYAYSDISRAFLLHAEEKFAPGFAALTTRIFDVEQPAAGQNIGAGFDVVIATNVLHATRNIRRTLRNVRAALKNGGLILINELSEKSLFAHVTFGLLEGWWLYEDVELRIPGSPALYPDSWKAVLETAGFGAVSFPASHRHGWGQQIIAAENIAGGSALQKPDAPLPQTETLSGELREKSIAYFKSLFASTLKIPAAGISTNEPLETYGIDSILIVQITNRLREVFGDVSSTLLFELRTLGGVADHFMQTRRPELSRLFNLREPAATAAPAAVVQTAPLPAPTGVAMPHARFEPVAIIGASGRYPGAENLEAFWENLQQGRDCITEIPPERWSLRNFFVPDPEQASALGRSYSKWGGFLTDVDKFDPRFFNLSPREAERMDPQERLFLENCWLALENAGYTRGTGAEGRAKVGVFVGVTNNTYQLLEAADQAAQPSSVPWSIANRVSYLFDFDGPSVPVDTACSSSLTAIHMACQSLRNGESETALAGGVNLYLHPAKYIGLCQLHMLSPRGRCDSFGAQGDGFVPGEGVGVVVLKPLGAAEADGDHIHALIRGTSVNHGGKTNGYTVPNPSAQADLIRTALDNAGVHARAVSYIEAHGTGTELGDPIEIAGLSQAFRRDTGATGFCAIGSVKSAIGHLEAAAGIAALSKVLLQLQHRQLAPSLHADNLNPNIEFAQTPFSVQRELAEWHRPQLDLGGGEKEYPRIAGISSFGAGGANAHIVIEEYLGPADEGREGEAVFRNASVPIVLSAKNAERLRVLAARLSEFLRQHDNFPLSGIAYTLQTGREALEERLGLMAESVAELREKLGAFVAGTEAIESLYRGRVKRDANAVTLFAADEELQEAVGKWIARGKYTRLLELWVQGLEVDWRRLYGERRPRRLALPGYPFARERYWISEHKGKLKIENGERTAVLHPLAQRNTSTYAGPRFTSVFSGEEFFLGDHRIGGRKVLPGAAYLEMVRAAAVLAAGENALVCGTPRGRVQLKHVTWLQPLVVEVRPVSVSVGLTPKNADDFAFKVYRHNDAGDSNIVAHSQGLVSFVDDAAAPAVDIEALKSVCNRSVLSATQCYSAFQAAGLDYGPAHRCIERLLIGDGRVLAQLSPPPGADRFGLHPGLLDSALQACIGLTWFDADDPVLDPALPFALETLEIYNGTTAVNWAVLTFAGGEYTGGDILRLDIDLCDACGSVCARLRGFAAKFARSQPQQSAAGTLFLQPEWTVRASNAGRKTGAGFERHYVILCHGGETLRENLQSRLTLSTQTEVAVLEFQREAIEARFEQAAAVLLTRIQTLLKTKAGGDVLLQIVVFTQAGQQLLSGLSGLLKSARRESPRLIAQLLSIDSDPAADSLAELLSESGRAPQDSEILYREGRCLVADWSGMPLPAFAADAATPMPWKRGGVYLISGGAGGLGMIVAADIARRADRASLILCGRSELDAHAQGRLQALRDAGARVEYRRADCADRDACVNLVDFIKTEFGALDGVIHSAGLVRDNLIVNKTARECAAVLAPKVAGAVNLDLATRDLPLGLFVLFSSAAAALGNAGQADYAAANGFMDHYAVYRNGLVRDGRRSGKTLSINWPLWREGGMRLDAHTEKLMRDNAGLMALETDAGLEALHLALAHGRDRVLVLYGRTAQIKRKLLGAGTAPATAGGGAPADSPSPSLQPPQQLQADIELVLTRAICRVLKLRPEDIDANEEIGSFGFDSITLTELTNLLNRDYRLELTPVIFFEYDTVRRCADYLAAEFPQRFAEPAAPANPAEDLAPATPLATGAATDSGAVAVIGLSGCFPMARDVHTFWENLLNGRDCIGEIPASRWNWRGLYGDPRREPGKTEIKWGGFIEDIDQFDPLFFGITPREALVMDPQQRLLMQHLWQAIEDAGYAPQSLAGSQTGIFVGTASSGYSERVAKAGMAMEGYSATGMVPSVGPNRMSFLLDLHGPSEPVETACSSSLVAIHRAVESIHSGRCEMAVAGGVNTIVTPQMHIGFNKAGMLSADGRCKTFAAGADGYVRGEGAAMLLLKPLGAAQRDGDHIYGLIRASAENHGGRANSLTAPNPKAQAALLQMAYRQAAVPLESIGYIEVHGTGTKLGDPVEIQGLKTAFGQLARAAGRPAEVAEPYCGLGSVKTNIGHLELAAGAAGVVKVLLQMRHKTLVKSLHCERVNPYIELHGSPFYIVQETRAWLSPRDAQGRELPRRAGVSSFGFGGVNAHVVLEEYRGAPREAARIEKPFLIPLSAATTQQLQRYAENLRAYLQRQPALSDTELQNTAYTLQVGRQAFEERLLLAVRDSEELLAKLNHFLRGELQTDADIRGVTGEAGHIAGLWAQGRAVDWGLLYPRAKPGRVSLPTYPFAHERYWVDCDYGKATGAAPETFIEVGFDEDETTADNQRPEPAAAIAGGTESAATTVLQTALIREIREILLLKDEHRLTANTTFQSVGLDSISRLSLLENLNRKLGVELRESLLFEYPSVGELATYLSAHYPGAQGAGSNIAEQPKVAEKTQTGSSPAVEGKKYFPRFPELIQLNDGSGGWPIFWFHGGLGGVETYRIIADRTRRPFYGIKAKGWMSGREPLKGIEAMTAYYLHIIQSVQPQGPYDLGGYSLGGMIAYEATRQLQEFGQHVDSIVMLDTLDSAALQNLGVAPQSEMLQAVNMALQSGAMREPAKWREMLIHQQHLNPDLPEAEFLAQLIELARERGLKQSPEQLQALVRQTVKVQRAFEQKRYSLAPLPDPQAVAAWYFRNGSGLFYGDLWPYYTLPGDDPAPLENTEYWAQWPQYLPRLQMREVNSPNHLSLLSAPAALEGIVSFCDQLYADPQPQRDTE